MQQRGSIGLHKERGRKGTALPALHTAFPELLSFLQHNKAVRLVNVFHTVNGKT
jgi:hypothetical protein